METKRLMSDQNWPPLARCDGFSCHQFFSATEYFHIEFK